MAELMVVGAAVEDGNKHEPGPLVVDGPVTKPPKPPRKGSKGIGRPRGGAPGSERFSYKGTALRKEWCETHGWVEPSEQVIKGDATCSITPNST